MLDRSIPTREALVHSIPNSEVKDMKSDFYGYWRHLFLKNTSNLIHGLNFNNFQEKNCIDFEFLSATFPPLGSIKFEIR
jgi:hypothetical protein